MLKDARISLATSSMSIANSNLDLSQMTAPSARESTSAIGRGKSDRVRRIVSAAVEVAVVVLVLGIAFVSLVGIVIGMALLASNS